MKWLVLIGLAAVILCGAGYRLLIFMPGTSFRGTPPPLTDRQHGLRDALRGHVAALAGDIGPRHAALPGSLERAADYIANAFTRAGYQPQRRVYEGTSGTFANIQVEIAAAEPDAEIVVVGAHYDSVPLSPAANDNGSGIAVLIELARLGRTKVFDRTLRFVAFANEELPYSHTSDMGSRAYAQHARAAREPIAAMLSLETLGYYTDHPRSQRYPPPLSWFYPATGNFVAFVGDVAARPVVVAAVAAFREHGRIPSEGATLPRLISDVGRSDHKSFWDAGYPAFMVTDTAPFRYPHYHRPEDTPDKLDFARLTLVVEGLVHVVDRLAAVR